MSNNNKVDIINNEDREHINSNNFQLLKNVNLSFFYIQLFLCEKKYIITRPTFTIIVLD